MAAATDQQMQIRADTRIRPRAESARDFVNALRDDKAAGDPAYERAAGANADPPTELPWNDARIDGPPKLLTHQDILVYNSIATLLLACIDGEIPQGMTADQVIEQLSANWPVFQSACVRAL